MSSNPASNGYERLDSYQRASTPWSPEDQGTALEIADYSHPRHKRNLALVFLTLCTLGGVAYGVVRNVLPGFSNNKSNKQNDLPSIPGVEEPTLVDAAALSTMSPVELGFPMVDRPEESSPGKVFGKFRPQTFNESSNTPLPTGSWYQNLLSNHAGERSTEANQAYTVPYVVDTVGPITGIRMHWPVIKADARNVQLVFDAASGLTVGTANANVSKDYVVDGEDDLSLLGVTLQWQDSGGAPSMTSPLVRGMPYITMIYNNTQTISPSLASGDLPLHFPILDGNTQLICGSMTYENDPHQSTMLVEREIELQMKSSDYTWLIFVSRPVRVRCSVADRGAPGVIVHKRFQLDVLDDVGSEGQEQSPLIMRAALASPCTTGRSNVHENCQEYDEWTNAADYAEELRKQAGLFPKSPLVSVDLPKSTENDGDEGEAGLPSSQNETDDSSQHSRLHFHWNAQSMQLNNTRNDNNTSNELIMFALPHHLTNLHNTSHHSTTNMCLPTFHGKTCLVRGATWSLEESMGRPASFYAPRPPHASAVPDLAVSVGKEIGYRIPDNVLRGAIDTYFSGKLLAKLARIIMITSELKDLAGASDTALAERYGNEDGGGYAETVSACKKVKLPKDETLQRAVDMLRRGVEVWLNGKAEAMFTYDGKWGGLVNCGCIYKGYDEHGKCSNKYPTCPALTDPNQNFGNGYYNDHHFHYGYHIYGAAVVAKFNPAWGRKFFGQVLTLIRDIANPSADDPHFPLFRQKDWYLGSSWASGLMSMDSPHGRNQESSSEAIAAYEAVALYGGVMVDAWADDAITPRDDMVALAKRTRDLGQLLTATEVRAAGRYWHVGTGADDRSTYPAAYTQPVVGMLYQTMASFQTWFSPEPYVSYGIQLLPFTPVAEERDDPYWVAKLCPLFQKSCDDDKENCVQQGWSIIIPGLLATIGRREEAMKMASSIPSEAYDSAGGNGQSVTNTLWYVSTRPDMNTTQLVPEKKEGKDKASSSANHLVGPAAPDSSSATALKTASQVPDCSREICDSSIARCPINTYLCTSGPNKGGCSGVGWEIGELCGGACLFKEGC